MRAAQNAHQTPNRVLLLEDDRELGRFIATGLQHNGFDVMHIRDGRKGLAHSKRRAYDVILLDVMMPGMNGFDVLKALRSDNFKGGIIMLTCQGQESDRIDGLNRGADDYIVKPFLAKELHSRIRAVLRRTSLSSRTENKHHLLISGDLTINSLTREAHKDKKPLILTKKEFDLLHCFMQRPGHVFSHAVIGEQIFQNDFVAATNTITVHIKNLRAKIDGTARKSHIRTVRGCGYAFQS